MAYAMIIEYDVDADPEFAACIKNERNTIIPRWEMCYAHFV